MDCRTIQTQYSGNGRQNLKTYINLLIFCRTFVESSESNMERNDYEYNAILNSNITYDAILSRCPSICTNCEFTGRFWMARFKGTSHQKRQRKDPFIQSREIFDKYLKQCQRIYRKNTINELNDVCIVDPRRFWEHIQKLGPRKSSSIPMTVKTVNGLSNDTNTILGEWKTEFENLYKPPDIL